MLIDAARWVTEKEQLHRLDAVERAFVRRARDDVRARITAGDPLFDARSDSFALPADASALGPVPD